MLLPSIFNDNVFDDFMDGFDSFMDRSALYGKHGKNLMKTDVRDVGDHYELDMDLPGFKKDEIHAELENGYLTISAEKSLDKDEKDKAGHYIRRERSFGRSSRTFFVGDGVKSLTMEDRLCICNMAIEAGAKNGIFPVDEITEAYLKGRSQRPWVKYEADPDAEYERSIVIDLDALEPTVSYPHLPENTHLAKEGKDIKIDQIVIGSCTNGRIEDMEAAYEILKGRHIAKGVRGIIIPATMAVYKECILRGYTEAFIDAGCIVSTPTCGPCLGGYMGILAAGERCVSTTNRNFVGRMGHVDSEVYLASPATAAASALTGYITDPREV